MGYTKLDEGFATSSILVHGLEVAGFWAVLLSMARPGRIEDGRRVGVVDATVPALAALSRTTPDRVRALLAILEGPDPESRTAAHEGRRIRITREPRWRIEILNYYEYREKDHTAAERQRRRRHAVTAVTPRDITQAEAEAEAKAEAKSNTKKGRALAPPTRNEVLEYARQRGRALALGDRFYDYFTEGLWMDAKGNPVRNWKQKFITWEKHEPPRPAEVKENPEVRAYVEELRSRGRL